MTTPAFCKLFCKRRSSGVHVRQQDTHVTASYPLFPGGKSNHALNLPRLDANAPKAVALGERLVARCYNSIFATGLAVQEGNAVRRAVRYKIDTSHRATSADGPFSFIPRQDSIV
jgi:hypothetical protein